MGGWNLGQRRGRGENLGFEQCATTSDGSAKRALELESAADVTGKSCSTRDVGECWESGTATQHDVSIRVHDVRDPQLLRSWPQRRVGIFI